MDQLALFTEDDTTRRVSMAELQRLWAKLDTRGELWNGMTDHYLRERYGSRLRQDREGWTVDPAGA